MVDLTYSAEEVRFRAEISAWLAANPPRSFPGLFDADLDRRVEAGCKWQRALFDAGWAGVSWPAAYGGRGASLTEEIIYIEEMGRAGAPAPVSTVGLDVVGPLLIDCGQEAQRERFLRPILKGEEIWCLGISEPNAGSDASNMATRAVLEGDQFVINGEKIWTSFATYSDWCLLIAKTDPASTRHRGLSCLAVPMDAPGVELRPLAQIHGDTEFAQTFFRDVRIPRDLLIGELHGGWGVLLRTLEHERTTFGVSRQMVLRQYAHELLELACAADAQGRSGISDPVIRQKIARVFVEVEVFGQYCLMRTGEIAKRGPGIESSVDKLYWTEMDQRMQDVAMDIAGLWGQLVRGHELSPLDGQLAHRYLQSKAETIYSGTSEIQRNIIGEMILRLPR